jgi:uncharacterized membrane protein YdbT with pleckstrin-like domain
MSYIDTHLLENEQVLYRTKMHWILFAIPIGWVFAGLFFNFKEPQIPMLAILPILIGIGTGISAAITYASSEFGVTNKRVLIKVGFIRIDSIETLLSKIESIQVHQTILGRILGYGSIVICGTGGTKDPFNGIDNPLQFRKAVQEQIEKILHTA